MTEQVALSIGSYYNTKRPDIIDTNNSAANSSAVKGQTITDVNNTKPNATSLYQFGQATTTDYQQALARIDDWWQTNLTTTPPYLTNGSGLCRDCTLTAANLNELLSFAYRHPSFDAYVNSLGVAGVSGTIMHHSERLPESKAIGRAWIKTGTLSNVTAMAGYVKGQSGQDYAVVGIINTDSALNPYLARPVLDAMLDWTAEK
jgi:D-alanyl-D-alanine carboxypeptidase/D-alanyl-D-alanine-endopeptidase (penicillin-binding protein 4)